MKHVAQVVAVSCAALFLLLASGAHAQDPEADFDGFRIPDHRWQTLSAALSGTITPQKRSGGGSSSRDEFLNGRLGASFAMEHDTDLRQQFLQANVSVVGQRRTSQSSFTSFTTESQNDSKLRTLAEQWSLYGEARWYREDMPLALALSASIVGGYAQSWYRVSSWDNEPVVPSWGAQHGRETRRNQELDETVALTVGYGRARDATGIYSAYVLEQRLQEAGALARPLSPAARQRIAGLYYERAAFAKVHDRPDRYFWREVEKVLRDDGAIDGSLDGYTVMRVNENLGPATQVLRQTGFFAGPVLQGTFTQLKSSTASVNRVEGVSGGAPYLNTYDADVSTDRNDENVAVGARFEYHRPLGLRWQVDVAHEAVVPVLHVEKGLSIITSGQLAYLVADRWLGRASFQHARRYLQPDPGRLGMYDRWQMSWSAGLDYYVEDQVKIGLSIQDVQLDVRDYGYEALARGTQVALSVTYSFISRLEIANLGAPPPVR